MKTEILAYTAGIIDGEGSIQITTCNKDDWTASNMALKVKVCVIRKKLIDWLCDNFGGYRSTVYKNNRTYYWWQVDNQKAENLLKQIYPYSVIKQNEIEVALKYRQTIRNDKYKTVGWERKIDRMILKTELNVLHH